MKLAHLLPYLACLSFVAAGVNERQANEDSTSVQTSDTVPATISSTTTGDVESRDEDGTNETGFADSNSGTDTEAGASGSQAGSFSLSRGGLVAIIVVVAFVAILGVASTVLFVLAKRRSWNIRQSLKRASRRFTGRATRDATRDRQSKRAGLQMSRIPAQRIHTKRGMAVQVDDVEKGSMNISKGTSKAVPQEASKTQSKSKWSEKLWSNDWQK